MIRDPKDNGTQGAMTIRGPHKFVKVANEETLYHCIPGFRYHARLDF
jgi:hypothetical protein